MKGRHMLRRILSSAIVALTLLAASSGEAVNISPTFTAGGGRTTVITWAGMAGADTPLAGPAGQCIDLTVQVTGTFGTTTVTLTGSLDDTTYATLNDTAGTPAALSFTAAGYKHVQERALFLKPGLSGGTGTGLSVRVLCQNP